MQYEFDTTEINGLNQMISTAHLDKNSILLQLFYTRGLVGCLGVAWRDQAPVCSLRLIAQIIPLASQPPSAAWHHTVAGQLIQACVADTRYVPCLPLVFSTCHSEQSHSQSPGQTPGHRGQFAY